MTRESISTDASSVGEDSPIPSSGGPGRGAVAATTQVLLSSVGGVIAAVAYFETATGEVSGRLIQLDDRGGQAGEILAIQGAVPTDGGYRPPVFLELPDHDAKLLGVNVAGGATIRALDESMAALAESITGLSPGDIACLASSDDRLVALRHMPNDANPPTQELFGVALSGEALGGVIDTAALDLSDRRRITALAMFSGALYVAVADSVAGCDIYRSGLNETGPGWETVLSRGGGRYSLNAAVSAMRVGPHGLLVGTAALAAATLQIGNWGPELLLFLPDGGWDLVIGQPRFSPEGLRLPASALTPGIDSPANAAVKVIAGGRVGKEWITVVALQEFSGAPAEHRGAARPDFSDYRGAARIFRSRDLVDWDAVTGDLPADIGEVTSLCVTDHGLVVGHQGSGADRPPVTLLPH